MSKFRDEQISVKRYYGMFELISTAGNQLIFADICMSSEHKKEGGS